MGKGDWRRPCQVPKEQYDRNFEVVFGKKKLNVAEFVAYPDDLPKRYNACTDPCDALVGPCCCGAWHDRNREADGDISTNGYESRDLHAESRNATDEEPSSWEDEPCKSCDGAGIVRVSNPYAGLAACGDCHGSGLEGSPLWWSGPGYRGEYTCPHGVGHGNHIHGCCGCKCCQRPDFPLRGSK